MKLSRLSTSPLQMTGLSHKCHCWSPARLPCCLLGAILSSYGIPCPEWEELKLGGTGRCGMTPVPAPPPFYQGLHLHVAPGYPPPDISSGFDVSSSLFGSCTSYHKCICSKLVGHSCSLPLNPSFKDLILLRLPNSMIGNNLSELLFGHLHSLYLVVWYTCQLLQL